MQKKLRAPLCVVYDLNNDRFRRGRAYKAVPVMLEQLGVMPA